MTFWRQAAQGWEKHRRRMAARLPTELDGVHTPSPPSRVADLPSLWGSPHLLLGLLPPGEPLSCLPASCPAGPSPPCPSGLTSKINPPALGLSLPHHSVLSSAPAPLTSPIMHLFTSGLPPPPARIERCCIYSFKYPWRPAWGVAQTSVQREWTLRIGVFIDLV